MGTILMVIIAVAVTIATKGAAAKFAAGLVKAVTGATALTGAAASAAGASAVSQLAGMAMGIQDKFDWKGVGVAAISGGLGAGAGKTGNIIKDAARSMVRSAVTQGIGVTPGLQDKFSWAAVAIGVLADGIDRLHHQGRQFVTSMWHRCLSDWRSCAHEMEALERHATNRLSHNNLLYIINLATNPHALKRLGGHFGRTPSPPVFHVSRRKVAPTGAWHLQTRWCPPVRHGFSTPDRFAIRADADRNLKRASLEGLSDAFPPIGDGASCQPGVTAQASKE